jgi:hypothetical protein
VDTDEPHDEQDEQDEHLTPFQRVALAAVRAEVAEMERAASAPPPDRRTRRRVGPSVVLSVRMVPAEFAALERRAMATGLSSSGLARNLIRSGLGQPPGITVADVACELEAIVHRLREAVG